LLKFFIELKLFQVLLKLKKTSQTVINSSTWNVEQASEHFLKIMSHDFAQFHIKSNTHFILYKHIFPLNLFHLMYRVGLLWDNVYMIFWSSILVCV